MLQLKTPRQGVATKGVGGANVWISPQRDLVHAFSIYVQKALHILDTNPTNPAVQDYYDCGGTQAELDEKLAPMLVRFIGIARDVDRTITVTEAAKESGFFELDGRVKKAFGSVFTDVLFSAYFSGIREAMHGEYVDHLFDAPGDFAAPIKGVRGWCKNLLKTLACKL